MLATFKERYIGSRAFYRHLLVVLIPLIIQQGITSFVNLLDNVMVGSLGTSSINAVAIVNQLIFVFNLTIFGGLSGASIFGAQFYGSGDEEGMRYTVRIKMWMIAIASVAVLVIFGFWGEPLAGLFLNPETNSPEAMLETMALVREYLFIAMWGLVPFAVVQAYGGTLRETGETFAPMAASVLAISLNLAGNWLLIFGNLGFPRMGVAGAALATALSRWAEMLVVVIFTHRNLDRYPFMRRVYAGFHIPGELLRQVMLIGSPLMFNEIFWSLGTTFVNQNYSTRGLVSVAANNITSTVWQLFCVIMFAMGSAVSILVGQKLGANEIEEAKAVDRRLLFLNLVLHILIGVLIILAAPFIPLLYNTEAEVRQIATQMLVVAGLALPITSTVHCAYFTIRSGGKTFVTLLFDSVYTWLVPVPLSFVLARYTAIPIVAVYAAVQFSEFLKLCIAIPLLRSGFWANNMVVDQLT